PCPRRRHFRSRLSQRQAVLAVDRRRRKFRRQGRSQNRDPRGARRHLRVFPLHLGRLDAVAEAPAARQGSRRMAPASFRLSARRRASLQRRPVSGTADPGTANYRDNFTVEADTSGGPRRSRLVAPLRLPKVVAATTDALGDIDLDPNHGESDGARWFMTEKDSVPYSTDVDARIPTGTV